MANDICYIFGAGEYGNIDTINNIDIQSIKSNFSIAADGGYSYLEKINIIPDMLVGDFDSLDKIPKACKNVIKHPAIKDDTDMMLAVKQAIELGYKKIIIYGGLGGRLDHTLANIQVLHYAVKQGVETFLIGDTYNITLICGECELFFNSKNRGIISIISLTDRSEGIYLTGLKYKLNDAVITTDFPIGVSNEFTGQEANVQIRKGAIIVIWESKSTNELPIIKMRSTTT